MNLLSSPIFRSIVLKGPAGSPAAVISLDNTTISENASIGAIVGSLSVLNATGTPTFSLVDDAGGKFDLNSGNIRVAGALDYETVNHYSITVGVSGTTPDPSDRSFVIAVSDFTEAPPGAINMQFNSAANSHQLVVLEDF